MSGRLPGPRMHDAAGHGAKAHALAGQQASPAGRMFTGEVMIAAKSAAVLPGTHLGASGRVLLRPPPRQWAHLGARGPSAHASLLLCCSQCPSQR